MPDKTPASDTPTSIEIDLRDPPLAALLAWLVPGLGHIYQRRYAKGVLFMVCILGTFFFGLVLGEGKVVYAANYQDNVGPKGFYGYVQRWPFALQMGVGLPASPAIVQTLIVKRGGKPLMNGIMAPPKNSDTLGAWHDEMGTRFDLAQLYTIVAGLLNWLAIYDAAAGPAFSEPAEGPGPPDEDEKKKKKKSDTPKE